MDIASERTAEERSNQDSVNEEVKSLLFFRSDNHEGEMFFFGFLHDILTFSLFWFMVEL